jgi:prophage regulatory protein
MTRALIRRAELRRRVPYSDVTIWRMERDGLFPRRVQLGPHAVAWYEDEVEAWCASRIRDGAHRPPGRRYRLLVEPDHPTD